MGWFGGGKKRILVADDDPHIRAMLVMLVENSGYEPVEAARGDDALRIAQEKPPDLVLLDIMMPGLSGVQVLQALRMDAKTKAVPVIMCTALDTLEQVERCLGAGANDYIRKPFDLKAVLARIQKALEG